MKNILRAAYKPDEKRGCFILVSGHWRNEDNPHDDLNLAAITSFVYDAGDKATEWSPATCGPLHTFFRADATTGKPHYIYPFIEDRPLEWSQMAVNNHDLPRAFVQGDYDYIFTILKNWTEARE